MRQWFFGFPDFTKFSENLAHLGKTPCKYVNRSLSQEWIFFPKMAE